MDQKVKSQIKWEILDPFRNLERIPEVVYPHPSFAAVKNYFSEAVQIITNPHMSKPKPLAILTGPSGSGKTSSIRLALSELKRSKPDIAQFFVAIDGSACAGELDIYRSISFSLGIPFNARTSRSEFLSSLAARLYSSGSPLFVIVDDFDSLARRIKSEKFWWAHSLIRLQHQLPSVERRNVDVFVFVVSTNPHAQSEYFGDPQVMPFVRVLPFVEYSYEDLRNLLSLSVKRALPENFIGETALIAIVQNLTRVDAKFARSNVRLALAALHRAVQMAVAEDLNYVSAEIAAKATRSIIFSQFANVLLSKPSSYRRVLEAACFARLKELSKTSDFFDLLLTTRPLTTDVILENYFFLCGVRKETPVKKRRFLELLSELVSDRLLALVSRGLYTPLMDVEDVLRVVWDIDGEINKKGEVVKVGG